MSALVWEPTKELAAVHWEADMAVVNHVGEHVWLQQLRTHLTDCCLIDEPCERHAVMRRPDCEREGCVHSYNDYPDDALCQGPCAHPIHRVGR